MAPSRDIGIAGLPADTRLFGGRLGDRGAAPSPSGSSAGFLASIVSHASMELEVPPQTAHRISMAIGRRPGVWTDIPGRRTVADLGHLHANVVPAAHGTWVDDPTPGRFLFLRLEADRFGAWLGDEGRSFRPRPAFNLADPVLARAARTLLARLRSGRHPGALALDALATRLALRLAELAAQPPVLPTSLALAPWELRRIEEFIDANLAGTVDLDALAGLVDRPRLHLLQGFVAAFGSQPHVFVAGLRLRRARRLLEAGDIPTAAVAAACGFASAAGFGRAFRDALGIGPSRYRRLRA